MQAHWLNLKGNIPGFVIKKKEKNLAQDVF